MFKIAVIFDLWSLQKVFISYKYTVYLLVFHLFLNFYKTLLLKLRLHLNDSRESVSGIRNTFFDLQM